jgi:NhaP-type Na+/H+ or K+/H+ antiporter
MYYMNSPLRKAKILTFTYATICGVIGVVGCYPIYLSIYCAAQCDDNRIIVPLVFYVISMFTVVLVGAFLWSLGLKHCGFICQKCGAAPYNPIQRRGNANKCQKCGAKLHV